MVKINKYIKNNYNLVVLCLIYLCIDVKDYLNIIRLLVK